MYPINLLFFLDDKNTVKNMVKYYYNVIYVYVEKLYGKTL